MWGHFLIELNLRNTNLRSALRMSTRWLFHRNANVWKVLVVGGCMYVVITRLCSVKYNSPEFPDVKNFCWWNIGLVCIDANIWCCSNDKSHLGWPILSEIKTKLSQWEEPVVVLLQTLKIETFLGSQLGVFFVRFGWQCGATKEMLSFVLKCCNDSEFLF